MAALTQHSQKAISDIIKEMTRPITDILGEPPLTPLETRPRKRSLPIPLRSREPSSDAEIMAITTSYQGPEPFLQGGRVSGDLCPPRKRSRGVQPLTESVGKKRRREEKPPRPENGTKKLDEENPKKSKTEEVKPRPLGIKLTSQPVPRETKDETAKKARLSNGTSVRKKEESVKDSKRETKKHVKKELDDTPKKDSTESKETARKQRSPIPRIPASVIPASVIPASGIPRSEPRPLKTSSREENGSDADHQNAKIKKKGSEQNRLSSPRVPASETAERRRRDEMTRPSVDDSQERSAPSSGRRRPRSRQANGDNVRHRDREYDNDKEFERQKGSLSERDRDWGSDRERSDRAREGPQRSSARTDREKDVDKTGDPKKDRRDRDGERDRERENGNVDYENDRVYSDRSKDRARDHDRDRERPSLTRALPPSRPDSARESTSAGQSPGEVRGASLSSKPVNRTGSSQSPASEGAGGKSARRRHGRAELQQNLAKQKDLEKHFKIVLSKCAGLYKKKDYDGFEKAAKEGFRISFDLGLAMETELRLTASTFRTMNATERAARKRTVINHYKFLTKTYVPRRMEELEQIGRKEGCAFYKRGTQKVYFRMFHIHNLWDKDVQHSNNSLKRLLSDTIKVRSEGQPSRPAEEELPTRKLKMLKRLVDDHINILSIFEGIAADVGGGFEEAGAEGYVP